MTTLITGGNGQLGTELRKYLDEKGVTYVATDTKELDITDKAAVIDYINKLKPEIVFHCAAYTAVDKAEDEGKELNQLVNVEGTINIAEAAEKFGAIMVYVSTDYVFDGTNLGEYQPDDVANPKNEYGRAKYEGEIAVKANCSKYYIVRTSWVFGAYGPNFVFTMERLAKEHSKLTVVDDQFGRPTWTRNLAEFMFYLYENKVDYGVYQFSNDNSCSWYEFAKEILKNTDVEVAPVDSSAYPQKATRPKHSVMNLDKAKATGFKIPTWQEALSQMKASLK